MLDDSCVCEFYVLNYMEYQLHVLKSAASAMPYSKTAEIQMQYVSSQSADQSVCQTLQKMNNTGVQDCAATHTHTHTLADNLHRAHRIGVRVSSLC